MADLSLVEVEKAIGAVDAAKVVDTISTLWPLIEQRARIKTRIELTRGRLATHPKSVRAGYLLQLASVIEDASGDLNTTAYSNFLINLRKAKELVVALN